MCGIVGYIGKNQAAPVLLEGLKRLEYRGYDSAGIAVFDKEKINTTKTVGKVKNLISCVNYKFPQGKLGIAHTRWATHGKPSKNNTHPHCDCHQKIWLAHNGIVENYLELKNDLIKHGHKFYSQTDTEVIAHLIEEFSKDDVSLEKAVLSALKKIKGTYGLVIISQDEQGKMIVARNASPLLIGVGDKEYIVASDASAIISYTKKVIYLNDLELAVITNEGLKIFDINEEPIIKKFKKIEWDAEEISKCGYKHYMLKEIHEIPEAIKNSIRGRMILEEGLAKLGGLEPVNEKLREIDRIIIVACGSARFAGLVGEYMLEEYAGIPVEVEYASEFRYRRAVLDKHTAVLAISQSGETADTLAAIKEAKHKGILTLGIVNVVGSTIARETDAGIYNHIGPEISVATTKAFVSQIIILALLTVFLGRYRQMSLITGKRILNSISKLPNQIEKIFTDEKKIENIAKKLSQYKNFLYLGRKYNFPIALEGALKLKEISYFHAEGEPTGEMKHGPIAMINSIFPCIFIAPKDSVYDKVISGIEEIKARNGRIIVIATEKDKRIVKLTPDVIYIPKNLEMLNPVLAAAVVQLLGYYVGVNLGYDVDKPKNLAKSVTVE